LRYVVAELRSGVQGVSVGVLLQQRDLRVLSHQGVVCATDGGGALTRNRCAAAAAEKLRIGRVQANDGRCVTAVDGRDVPEY